MTFRKVTPAAKLVNRKKFWQVQMTPWHMPSSIWMHFAPWLPIFPVQNWFSHIFPASEGSPFCTWTWKVCSLWPLNLDWDVQIFLLFRFAVFLKKHICISFQSAFSDLQISFNQISTSFQCTNNRICLTITWALPQLVANLTSRWYLPFTGRFVLYFNVQGLF